MFFFFLNFVTREITKVKVNAKREYRDDTAYKDLQPLRNSNRGIWNVEWNGRREEISMRVTL